MTPMPASPYAIHKLSAEHYFRVYGELFGIQTACLRFFNVFGPRQDPSSPYSGVISIFMNRALAGEAPNIYGDGRQSRDFIYVKDIVRALMLAADPSAAGRVINVGSGSSVTITELWERITALAGIQMPANYTDARKGDILHSLSSIQLARELLSFEPSVMLDDGLKLTFDWYRENR